MLQFETVTPVTAALMHSQTKYFITFIPKCFVAAVSSALRAILLIKICKILQFLRCFVSSAHVGHFCAKFYVHNRRLLTSLTMCLWSACDITCYTRVSKL